MFKPTPRTFENVLSFKFLATEHHHQFGNFDFYHFMDGWMDCLFLRLVPFIVPPTIY